MNNIMFDSLMWKTTNSISFLADQEFGCDCIYFEHPNFFGSQIDFYISTVSLI